MKILFYARNEKIRSNYQAYLEGAGNEVVLAADLRQSLDGIRSGGVTAAVLHDDVQTQDAVLVAATMGTQGGRGRLLVMRAEDDVEGRQALQQMGVTEILPAGTTRLVLSEKLTAGTSQAPSLTTFGQASSRELSALETLFGDKPDQVEGRWLLGFAYYRAGEFEDGYEILREVVRREPQRVQAQYYLGSCCYRLGRSDEARVAWEKVLLLAPETVQARKALQHLSRLDGGSEPPPSTYPGRPAS